MGKPGEPAYEVYKAARNQASREMKAYFPDVPRRVIHKADPMLWSIVFGKAVAQAKKEQGYVDRDQRAVADRQRGIDGRFGSLPSNAARSVS